MKKVSIVFALAFIFYAAVPQQASAQFNPFTDNTKMITAGFGFTGWGVPIFARFEAPVYDNVTVGGDISYQGDKETISGLKYKHRIFGIVVRGDYHFNELLELPSEWDVYAGLGIGYYSWKSELYDSPLDIDYPGSANGGFSVGVHVGGRYFFKDNLGVNLEFGGGNVLAGGTVGVTYLF